MSTARLTPLGKALRKMRIEYSERLLDMAEKLEVSTSFLAAVEMGRKPPPNGFGGRVVVRYQLDDLKAHALLSAETETRKSFVLSPRSAEAKQTVALLARNINELTSDQLFKIRAIAEKKESK